MTRGVMHDWNGCGLQRGLRKDAESKGLGA